jgi:hypothetical protein
VSTLEWVVTLVWDGVLLDVATEGWHTAVSEEFPTPETHKAVVFESAHLCGFGLPAHPFFCGLLYYYYWLELCHLNLNSILHIAIFIHLCVAYLGITPYFNLFRYFFWVKPLRVLRSQRWSAGAGFHLKEKHSARYILVPLIISNKGWHSENFFIFNPF